MKGKIRLAAAGAAMVLLILDSRQGMLAAAQGVEVCVKTVIPSLFPFFVLSIYVTGTLAPGKWLRPLGRLFSAPGCEGILICTFLGGYPVGAQAAAQACGDSQISKAQADRLLTFCSQAGPSFLFGMAAAQFPGISYGWMLWAVQLVSVWTVAAFSPAQPGNGLHVTHGTGMTLSGAMKRAIGAMSSVCGWVILFRVVIGFCQRWFLWLLPKTGQILFCGLLEITNGCILLTQIESIPLRFLLAVLFLNCGGVCVAMQTASVAEGLDMGRYVKGKLLQALASLCYGAVFLGNWAALLPLLGIFALRFPGKAQKSSSIPASVGV